MIARGLITCLAAAALAGLPVAAVELDASVNFTNGDTLRGLPSDLSKDHLLWNSPAFFTPEALRLDHILDLSLPAGTIEIPEEGDHIAILQLTNGDLVRGSLHEVTDEAIVLGTTFGGVLNFRRDMVDSLDIRTKPELYYSGPDGLDGWTDSHDDRWSYENHSLVTNRSAGISRDIGPHEQIHIAFDLEWRSSNRFRLLYFADSVDSDEVGGCYELTCHSRYAYLRMKRAGGAHTETIGTTSGVHEFREKEKVRLELLHDRLSGRIRLMLDGRIVEDWRDKVLAGDRLPGGAIHFISDSNTPVRISRIFITSWDGMIDGKWEDEDPLFLGVDDEENRDEQDDESSTGIRLRNGDLLEGATLGIQEGKVRIETPYGEVRLPISRLRSFALRTPEEAADPEKRWEPYRHRGDVRAWFTDGGHITFRLDGIGDETLDAYSQTFGDGEFKISSFERIEFNIHDWRLDELRSMTSRSSHGSSRLPGFRRQVDEFHELRDGLHFEMRR